MECSQFAGEHPVCESFDAQMPRRSLYEAMARPPCLCRLLLETVHLPKRFRFLDVLLQFPVPPTRLKVPENPASSDGGLAGGGMVAEVRYRHSPRQGQALFEISL
jgi:hypothetical protein